METYRINLEYDKQNDSLQYTALEYMKRRYINQRGHYMTTTEECRVRNIAFDMGRFLSDDPMVPYEPLVNFKIDRGGRVHS